MFVGEIVVLKPGHVTIVRDCRVNLCRQLQI